MTKTYKSFMQVAFSVVLPGGGSKRISFSPRTGGGSVYITADANVQKAIERHPSFGTKFFLVAEPKPAPKPQSKRLAEVASSEPEAPAAPTEKTEVREVPYTNLSDAKEYLAKTFEIGRTQLRSKEAIKKFAAMYGVVFVGIDDK